MKHLQFLALLLLQGLDQGAFHVGFAEDLWRKVWIAGAQTR